jgi:hypothetical protein
MAGLFKVHRTWEDGVGMALGVLLLAAWELWQDWKLSDKELARHGQ